MKRARSAGFVAVLAASFLLGGFLIPDAQEQQGPNLFRDVLTLVSTRYMDTLEIGEVYTRAAEGLVDRLDDPYAELFSPEDLEQFTVAYEGHYAGVGMLIELQRGSTVVRNVFPNTPAERTGVQRGDRLLAVDGQSIADWPLEKVSNALKGEPGTEVEVVFGRYGVPRPIQARITRAVVRIPAVPFATSLSGDAGEDIGYIPLLQFNETAADEVKASLRELTDRGVEGLVLDLRGNGGGIVEQAVRIAGLFLPEGEGIARQWERGTETTEYANESSPVASDLPLVVLIDGASASASEIVAGALQDHDRAVVLGTTSFGKGLVQTAYRVEGGYVLKMTTGKWYTPSGRSIHRERVVENGRLVEVDDSVHFGAGRDERPTYHSDAGRVVYGGGGITPDLAVEADTLSDAEQALVHVLLPQSPEFSATLFDMASELQGGVERGFEIRPEWRDDLYARLDERGVDIDRAVYDAGSRYVDRVLADRIGRLAFGDAYAKVHAVDSDRQLLEAIDILENAEPRQAALFHYIATVKQGDG